MAVRKSALLLSGTVVLASCLFPSTDGLSGGVGGAGDASFPDAGAEGAADGAPDVSLDAGAACPSFIAVPSGLIAYFPLNEDAGTTAHDCAGSGYDATLTGDTTWTAGRIGGALAFGGKSSCVALPLPTPSALDFDGTQTFTVAFFAEMATLTTVWPRYFLVGKTANPAIAGWRTSFEFIPARFSFALPDGLGGMVAVSSTAPAIPVGEMHHFVAVYEPTQTRVFVDGTQRMSVVSPVPFGKDTSSLRLGCSGDNQNFFEGKLDEVRFYDRALSTTEIVQLAAQK